jgi:hypothetical protein
MNQQYLDTARLLTKVAPLVFPDGMFALKGGTAINLFIRDMPRLSVDLDLVFVDYLLSREQALEQINVALRQAAERLKGRGFQTRLSAAEEAGETKLLVRSGAIEVKVEVNYVMRGTIFPVRVMPLTSAASERLMADLEIPVASFADVYGGKLVAAMDRQHPRDLFDVMELFAHGGITSEIQRAFVVYLASHNRPVHEVLFGARKEVNFEYEQNFKGMTATSVGLEQLLDARERMFTEIQSNLAPEEKEFLLSLVSNQPEWDLLGVPHLHQLPAVRWKLHNLEKLQKANISKFAEQHDKLEMLLN